MVSLHSDPEGSDSRPEDGVDDESDEGLELFFVVGRVGLERKRRVNFRRFFF